MEAPDPPWGSTLPSTFFQKDMNVDGVFTISDVVLWLDPFLTDWALWVFFLPGNSVIWSMLKHSPREVTFFELDTGFYSGWISGAFSVFVWLVGYSVLSGFFEYLESRFG